MALPPARLLAQITPKNGGISGHQLLRLPAVIFNRKDGLQDAFLALHLNLRGALYPRHFVPSVGGFERAVDLGLGWGMVPDVLLNARANGAPLQEVLPGRTVDVARYWGNIRRTNRWQASD